MNSRKVLAKLLSVAFAVGACGGSDGSGDSTASESAGGTVGTATGGTEGLAGATNTEGDGSGMAGGTGGTSGAGGRRGPLTGGTYCEKLASCCGQIGPFEHRQRCEQDLQNAQERFDPEGSCQVSARSFLSMFWCGPATVAGTISVTYEYGAEPPASFECIVQGSIVQGSLDGVYAAFVHVEGTEEARLICWSNAAEETVEFVVGTSPGTITDQLPLSGLFTRRRQGTTAAYSPTMVQTQSSTTDEFRNDGDVAQLRGRYTASWETSVDESAPGLNLSVTYDVTLPVLRENTP